MMGQELAEKKSNGHGGARANSGRKSGLSATKKAKELAANSGAYESESGNPYVDLTVAKVIHERAKAEMAKLELKKRIGELMLASEVSRDVATAFAAIAQDLRAIPDRLERQMGLAPEVAEAMAEQIDAALAALGARLRNLNAEESHARKRA